MKAAKRRQLLPVACFVALCVMFPSEAHANGINMGLVLGYGFVGLTILTLFVTLVEGIGLCIGLKVPYHSTFKLLLGANLASMAAGIPIKIYSHSMHAQILSQPLPAYFRACPHVILAGIALYFAVTIVVEFLIVVRSCRRRTVAISLRRIALSVVLANVSTYAVLAPLYYFWIRPIHDIRQFTDDSKWALHPPVTLYYISPDGTLRSVMTDGQGGREVVSDLVRDYQYLPKSGVFLYRNGTDDLCIIRKKDAKPISCWKTDRHFMMTEVACSPDGRIVAYLDSGELVLYDVQSGETKRTGVVADEDDHDPEIAWSQSPSVLFLMHRDKIEAITIDEDMSASCKQAEETDVALSEVYGRFGGDYRWGTADDWGASFSEDELGGVQAMATRGIVSHLKITVDGKKFHLSGNFGLIKLSNRMFNDVCILKNGREVIFDEWNSDPPTIYLLDTHHKKVGAVADGSKFIILGDRYRRTLRDTND